MTSGGYHVNLHERIRGFMTRINVIPPSKLTDMHAMAEYRELPMVNASLRRTKNSKKGLRLDQIPAEYTLNKGHVTFFYDKGSFLFNRYNRLIVELRKRGYNIDPSSRSVDWSVFDRSLNLWQAWTPTSRDVAINTERIVERIQQKPQWYRYYGNPISDTFIAENYKIEA